jgi:hypothetical protein
LNYSELRLAKRQAVSQFLRNSPAVCLNQNFADLYFNSDFIIWRFAPIKLDRRAIELKFFMRKQDVKEKVYENKSNPFSNGIVFINPAVSVWTAL